MASPPAWRQAGHQTTPASTDGAAGGAALTCGDSAREGPARHARDIRHDQMRDGAILQRGAARRRYDRRAVGAAFDVGPVRSAGEVLSGARAGYRVVRDRA